MVYRRVVKACVAGKRKECVCWWMIDEPRSSEWIDVTFKYGGGVSQQGNGRCVEGEVEVALLLRGTSGTGQRLPTR